jgi:hypothetical protein
VEDRAGGARRDDLEVEQGFRRGGAAAREHASVAEFQDIAGRQLALVRAAARDGEPERIAAGDGAEVAAGAEHPAARVEALADPDEILAGMA